MTCNDDTKALVMSLALALTVLETGVIIERQLWITESLTLQHTGVLPPLALSGVQLDTGLCFFIQMKYKCFVRPQFESIRGADHTDVRHLN